MKKSIILFILPFLLSVAGCDSPTGGVSGSPVTFSARTISQSVTARASARLMSAADPDSIRLSRVRILLRDIRFDREGDSVDYRTLPIVLDLQVTSALQNIFVGILPDGSYRRIRFRVHRIEEEDLRNVPPAQRPVYDDFLAGDRHSIIAEGMVFSGGSAAGESFVYRSRIDEEQEHEFAAALTLSGGSPATVTMTLDTGTWFADGSGGLLDPRIAENGNAIDDKIKASIDVFEDNDRNGRDD